MVIKRLYIESFGKIKNREISLADGINILMGENESGKSTLLSFIKFIFFGFPKKSADESISEKERYLSWDTDSAVGYAEISADGTNYRIERSQKGSSREKVAIIDMASGCEVLSGERPGEYFFGVSEAVFDSTDCIRQLRLSSIDGGDIGLAIENLALHADESVSTQKALSKIDAVRKKYLLKKGNGGLLYELNTRKNQLAARIDVAKQKNMQILSYESALDNLSVACKARKEELAAKERLCRAYDTSQLLRRFDTLHSTEDRLRSISAESKRIHEKFGIDKLAGFVPDRAFINSLSLSKEKILSSYAELEIKNAMQRSTEAVTPPDEKMCSVAKRIEQDGKTPEEITASYKKATSEAKKKKRRGIFFAILAVLSLLATAGVGVLFYLDGGFLGLLSKRGLAALGIGLIISLESFIYSAICQKKKKNFLKDASDVLEYCDFDEEREQTNLSNYLSLCFAALRKKELFATQYTNAKENVTRQTDLLSTSVSEGVALLEPLKMTADSANARDVAEALGRAISLCEGFLSEIDLPDTEYKKYKALLDDRTAELSEYNEAELRAAISPDDEEQLSSVNISILRRECDFIKSKLESSESRRNAYERELIGLRATAENLERLTEEYASVCRQAEESEKIFNALVLASESIELSSEKIKNNTLPRLREEASRIFSLLTNGKYPELGIEKDFSLSVFAEGETRPIDALSGGTRDAAYFALRIALCSVFYNKEKPPLLLDEVFAHTDDGRTKNALSMLGNLADTGYQILIFTCHSRESELSKLPPIKI